MTLSSKFSRRSDIKRQKQVAADFTLQRGGSYHEALGAPAVYNDERGEIEPLPAVRVLREALTVYNDMVEEHLRFSVKSCTFDDVFQELQEAEQTYEKKAAGSKNFLRKIWRKTGDNAAEINAWCDLVPADNGLNILSAGLKIVIGMAKRDADVRSKILEAFQDIPALMINTAIQYNQFAFDANLKRSAVALYETIARSLAELILLLNGNSNPAPQWRDRVVKTRRQLFGSSPSGRSIDDILKVVSRQASHFQACLECVRGRLDLETHDNVISAKTSIEEMQRKQIDIEREAQKLITEKAEQLQVGFKALGESLRNDMEAMNGTIGFLLARTSVCQIRVESPDPRQRSYGPLLSELDIMNSLGVYFREHLEDLQWVVHEQHDLDDESRGQAWQLLKTPKFSDWMSSTRGSLLWVNGNFEDAGSAQISSLSVVCGLFVLGLRQNTNFIVLHHFCGLHEKGYLAGPNGLMRSLLCQLLHSGHRFNLDFINTPDFADEIKSNSLRALCHTFSQLIERLPPGQTVVCIVEGVSSLETSHWLRQLCDVIFMLNGLVANTALRPVFKLLVTTPFNHGIIDGEIMDHQRLILQPEGFYGGGSEISDQLVWDEIAQANRLKYYERLMLMSDDDDDDDDEDDD
ncbi:hypothetical protein BJY04DRAFT_213811 [Aspergillus karnatakaensis]|uniref:uncharacterized protein n=1 Tax=Aspergillus karnatakaensis TaxID=1810916 RepID=UPI003CCD6AD1